MALSPVQHALAKKFSPEIVQTVLSMVEGFAPRGVDKATWRDILANWQDREPWRIHGLNPAFVREKIECWNRRLGPLAWSPRCGWAGLSPFNDRLCARPPIGARLVNAWVYLNRFSKVRGKDCKILEVNRTGSAFRHSTGRIRWGHVTDSSSWCRGWDVFDMGVLVQYAVIADN